jgi:hypothetical protein
MKVKELFEKYCKKTEAEEYICRGHYVTLDPASEEELEQFRKNCRDHHVEPRIEDELAGYYRQAGSLFNYFRCDDPLLFDWWQDDEQRSIWLGCLDDDSFIYDDIHHRYAVGFAGSSDSGVYDSLSEMLQAYLKEGQENGWNE